MDNNYIQLCAEMAYNEVLMEAVFEDENLLEADNKGGFKEKVKALASKCIAFIKSLIEKIKSIFASFGEKIKSFFSKEKVNKFKEKAKSKKNKSKAKNESTSLYNNLMNIVLTEADVSIDYVDYSKVVDHINKLDIDPKSSRLSWGHYADMLDDIDRSLSNFNKENLLNMLNKYKEESDKINDLTIKDAGIELGSLGNKKFSEFGTALDEFIDNLENDAKSKFTNIDQMIQYADSYEKVEGAIKDTARWLRITNDNAINTINGINKLTDWIYKANDEKFDNDLWLAARMFMSSSTKAVSMFTTGYNTLLGRLYKILSDHAKQFNRLESELDKL